MKLRLSLLLLSLVFLASSCGKKEDAPPASEGIKLELKLKQGDTYNLATDMNQKIEMSMNGQKMNMDQVMRFEVGMLVKEIKTDSTVLTENTYQRISMKQDMKGPIESVIEIDTKGNIKKGMMSELLLEQFKKMVGLTYTIEFDKYGNLKNTNKGEVLSKIAPVGSKNMDENISGASVPFPANPVKVGDTWKGEVTKKLASYDAKIVSIYTLKEVKGDLAHIGVESNILKSDDSPIGKITGIFDVVLLTGWTSQANITIKMDIEVAQGETKMPMKVETDMKITSTK